MGNASSNNENAAGWVKRKAASIFSNRKWQLDTGLLGLLILLFAMNIPLLTDRTHIFWDTFNLPYQSFAIIYGEVFSHGQLPFWLPFSVYGMPEFFSITCLSIVNFLFIGLGKILNVQDSLALFKASLVGEQILALVSMYLLAGSLFTKKWVVWVVCLSAMATFSVYRQIQFNFRQVYLLPLILFWLVQFFKRRRPEFLWLAGISMIFSLPGSALYLLVIEFYAIALFALILLAHDLRILREMFRPSRRNFTWLFVLILVAGVFLLYIRYLGMNGTTISRRGVDFSVSLNENLNFWPSWSPVELGVSFLYGLISMNITNGSEYIFYIGLLPLAGVAAACLYQRKPAWLAVLAAAIFLYWYSLSGFLSALVYYLPFVDVTRYISILGTIPFRTFLILAGGFGLDLNLTWNQIKKVGLVVLASALLLDVLGQLTRSSDPRYNEILINASSYSRDFKLFALRVAAYLGLAFVIFTINGLGRNERGCASRVFTRLPGLARAFPRIKSALPAGIVLVVLLDLALFRFNYETRLEKDQPILPVVPASILQVQPLIYQDQRLMTPSNERTTQLVAFSTALQAINPYLMESFTQFDRCLPTYLEPFHKFEVIPTSIFPLVNAGLTLYPFEQASTGLKQIYGCESPKIRVVSNVLVSESDAAALEVIKNTPDFSNLLVLSHQESDLTSDLNNPPPQADIKVVNFSANAITIEADLAAGNGGWLVYSDAYHPDWHAHVNGKEVKIEKAYLGFKSVPLGQGQNLVEFQFGTSAGQVLYTLVVLLSGLAALVAFGGVLVVLTRAGTPSGS